MFHHHLSGGGKQQHLYHILHGMPAQHFDKLHAHHQRQRIGQKLRKKINIHIPQGYSGNVVYHADPCQRDNDQSHLICDVAKTTDLLNEYFRTYGGPVYELDVPTLATVSESTDPNVQYMGQLDTEAEAGQAAG